MQRETGDGSGERRDDVGGRTMRIAIRTRGQKIRYVGEDISVKLWGNKSRETRRRRFEWLRGDERDAGVQGEDGSI